MDTLTELHTPAGIEDGQALTAPYLQRNDLPP